MDYLTDSTLNSYPWRVIVCADDYGLRDGINAAILELCDQGRLSAVSCMALFEQCNEQALARLLPFRERLDVGLHLCLTREEPSGGTSQVAGNASTSFPRYGELVRRALSRRIDLREVTQQLSAQYQLFVDKCGLRPDYIDGHLHAHHLPGVREAVLQFVLSLPAGSRPYVRNTAMPLRQLWRQRLPWLKSAFIGAFGARLCRRLRAAGVPTNDGFAGIYDFRAWQRYPDYFPRFVACLERPNGLLVVHPGHDEDWRRQELAVLGRFSFPPGRLNRFQLS